MEIALARGYVTRVDDDVAAALARRHLWVNLCSGRPYVKLRDDGQTVLLHRYILGLRKGDGLVADHVNGDTLDNRASNLRVCGWAGNARNCGKRRDNKSGYKGVSWDRGAWRAQIQHAGKVIHLGRFSDPEEAAAAYQDAAVRIHGEYARPLR